MIIFRYLCKEVLLTILSVTAILVLIFFCTQFIHYLTDVAGGRFTTSILLRIMLLQIPYLLDLLLPLGFFIALLITYGRLYADREMVVLFSSGFKPSQLLGMTLIMASCIALLVGVLSLGLSPYISTEQNRLFDEAKAAPLVETIYPGRFFTIDGGKKVIYVENLSRDRENLRNIFYAEEPKTGTNTEKNLNYWSVLTASEGSQFEDVKEGTHYLVIKQGNRYTGQPGLKDFKIESFDDVKLEIQTKNLPHEKHYEAFSTPQLWDARHNVAAAAEFQWRLAVPISVMLLALLAVPMSKVNPRYGRYGQLLPALLIYILYANMLFVSRSWIETQTIPTHVGLWWLHGLLLVLAVTLLYRQSKFRSGKAT